VVPGSGFDAPEFVRWSYATSMENIKEGMDRLERFLQGLENE
jgi:aspartate aminotransferase